MAETPDLPCPHCAHPRATVLLSGISCPMCGLTLPTNDEKRYGLTTERWRSLAKTATGPRPGDGADRQD